MPSGSNSSDYFSSQDSEFLAALSKTIFPGDIGYVESVDQSRDSSHSKQELTPPPPNQQALSTSFKRKHEEEDVYGAARFGDFGQYMKRKRAKLQIQNKDIAGDEGIFTGLSIYINGYTDPSIQDLRQLIVRHGGTFQPYLDKKTIVTHIITCSLTPAKIAEWKRMKICTPEWLVESANRQVLLSWRDYAWKPTNRSEPTQGVLPNQSSLLPIVPSASKSRPEMNTSVSPSKPGPSYAAHDSNPLAQRVMHNPEWRAAHTSVAPDFIDEYYKNSRLHHLSAWKAELKELLHEAQEKAENEIGGGGFSNGKVSGEGSSMGQELSMRGAGIILRSPKKLKSSTSTDVKGKGKASDPPEEQRVIMHCDFDCFFVAAGLTKRPQLKGKPVVVCHSQGGQGGEASTSEIASASYEAREFGIKNGMSLQQARKLCPNIITIPYEFELYKQFSLKFYTALMMHAADLQAVSVDEALVDVTQTVSLMREESLGNHSAHSIPSYDPAKELAEQIRAQVRESTGCEISIGISHNITLARLATRRAKPAKSYHLVPGEVRSFLAPLDLAELHGFGRAAKQKAVGKWGTSALGDLEGKSKDALREVFGKTTGETLYNLIRGVDERRLENDKERKSVSCDINYGIRFQREEEVKTFLDQLAKEVSKRLDMIQRRGRVISLKVMKRDPTAPVEPPKFLGHGACDVFNKQTNIRDRSGRLIATSDDRILAEHAWKLLRSLDFDAKELRGLGIQVTKLEPSSASATAPTTANSDTRPLDTGKPGQSRLSFITKGKTNERNTSSSRGAVKAMDTTEAIQKPTTIATATASDGPVSNVVSATNELPSFSQLDKSVFDALPHDIKEELEIEYKRRSESPFVPPGPGVPPAAAYPPPPGHGRLVSYRPNPNINPRKFPMKFPFPRKLPPAGRSDLHRIVAQLDPNRSRARFSISPRKPGTKYNKYTKLPGIASWKVPDSELLKLDIDPEVFAALPRNVQREQITAARMLQNLGYVPQRDDSEKLDLRPVEPDPGEVTILPPPKARFIQPPTLKQACSTPGEKLYFVETDDVQRVIEQWVMRFRVYPPNKQDVAFFAKWLVKSVDRAQAGDEGLLRAVSVMKWWLVLLKRWWGGYEYVGDGDFDDDPDEKRRVKIGTAWWDSFRDVKRQMDEVARRRFGGKLSLR
ncbi:hypothetical protein D9757_004806 [Collybiopsis confluens]|uniref:DNA repair protein REV1 n=1 Tax=Collybiopsis confluens TaxID=2823264 RepID=A0A8H5HSI6_9AGAR|nr:hypothetical protein D9757_004806 [Collybiopsis confluens]